jgi:hypothetical protein
VDEVSRIARAVLYEGYLLWPYRRSAPKNRSRWTFGAVFPPAWTAEHPDDACLLQGQYLVTGDDPRVTVTLRFLQVVERRLRDASGAWVDELDGRLAWEEATERELAPGAIAIPAGSESEPLPGGEIVRTWERLDGEASARSDELAPGLRRLTVRVRNRTGFAGDRPAALRHAFVSTHLALRVENGAFVSLTDPPPALRDAAAACENVGTWPVLVGADDTQMLSAPIILEDHPRVAPESPGDMYDGGEIDQLLILNVLGMSDAERAEMRASDERAREILDRCAAMGAEDLMRLHGTIREMRPL